MPVKVSNAVKPSVKAVKKETSSESSDDEESSDEEETKKVKLTVHLLYCQITLHVP